METYYALIATRDGSPLVYRAPDASEHRHFGTCHIGTSTSRDCTSDFKMAAKCFTLLCISLIIALWEENKDSLHLGKCLLAGNTPLYGLPYYGSADDVLTST